MARFAPVAPLHILERMNRETFGDYHLFLAHHTVENAEGFAKLVSDRTSLEFPKGYRLLDIIMDNSIVELGGAVDDQMIFEATKAVATNQTRVWPCLPDVMGHAKGTMELSEAAYHRWDAMGMNRISNNGYMLVVQGETWEAFKEIVDYFLIHNRAKFPNISMIGIPRFIMRQWAQTRLQAIEYVAMVCRHQRIKIHLLGFSQDIFDDMRSAWHPAVYGIDSAVPVRYTDDLTPGTTEEQIGKRGDWWESGTLGARQAMNIDRVRHWVNYGF